MKKLTTSEFVEKAIKIHGYRYDYSKSEYVNSFTKIVIVCNKHGKFLQSPNSHLRKSRAVGCPSCWKARASDIFRHSIKTFIVNARKVHGNIYDYSLSNYLNAKAKICIICLTHGKFWQRPSNHLRGATCPLCARIASISTISGNMSRFVNSAKKIHDNNYDYSKVNYINNREKVEIICNKHGSFWQTPNNHIDSKNGCPRCKCGYKISKPETEFLDYLKIPNDKFSRQVYIAGNKCVDGYDEKTNTVYEFLGDFWHGNPRKFNKTDINPIAKLSFGELYRKTFDMFYRLNSIGYSVKYIWESDWKAYRCGKLSKFPMINCKI